MNPKISVIISTYNRANLLPRTIKSVLNQTFQNFELIIIDDASTDSTEEVVKSFNDSRVIYIKNKKNWGGPARPKNIGIEKAQGEFVAFLDDDDEWLPQKLEKQLKIFEESKKNLGLVACYALDVCVDKNVVNKYKITIPKNCSNVFPLILEKCFIHSTSSVLIKKQVLTKLGYFDENLKVTDDWELWIRILKEYEFDFVAEPLFKYYFHGKNVSETINVLQRIKEIEYILEKYKIFYEQYPRAKAGALRHMGTDYLLAGDIVKARCFFYKSIRQAPFFLRNYINLLVSFLGIKIYIKIFRKKRGF